MFRGYGAFGLVLVLSLPCYGQELSKRAKALGNEEAKRYSIKLEGAETAAKLRKLQHWTNPVSSAYGVLCCWMSNEQPVAIGSIYMYADVPDKLNAEFQSLATEPLSASRDGAAIWHPKSAGIEFRVIDGVNVSTTETQQRLQLRRIARRFTVVSKSYKDGAPSRLRLLARPLLEYGSEEHALCGSLFAFVEGTDPDLLLRVEVARQDSTVVLRYALARLCIDAIDVQLDDQPIWSVPEHKHPYRRVDEPYSINQAIEASLSDGGTPQPASQ